MLTSKENFAKTLKSYENAERALSAFQNGEIKFSEYLRILTNIQKERIVKGEL